MQKKLAVSGLLISVLLSSCGSKMGLPDDLKIPLSKNELYVKPADVDYQELSYSNYSETVTVASIMTKIDQKEDFVLYMHSPECHYCLLAQPIFMKYICTTHYVFSTLEKYTLGNSDQEIIDGLGSLYPDLFSTNENGTLRYGTPYFYFFRLGELVASHGIPSKGFQSYRYFAHFLDSFVKAK